jgi:NitT/TauT family transport system substrate-binding protein
VALGVDWVIYGIYAPYFVAREKGYYKDVDLEVQIERGYGAADSLKKVLMGVSIFGLSDASSVVLARAQGGKAKMVAVVYQKAPHVIYFLKRSGIRNPKDLEGRTVGYSPGDAIYPLFPAFAKMNGVDASKVQWVSVEPAMKLPMLLAGKYEAVTFYILGRAQFEKGAAPLGGLGELTYIDHGLNIYSNGIVATDAFIAQNPGLVRGFLEASLKGFKDTFSNPEEALDVMMKSHPLMDRALNRDSIEVLRSLAISEITERHGIGYADRGLMEKTRDLIVQAYGLKAAIPLEDLYTNAFLK